MRRWIPVLLLLTMLLAALSLVMAHDEDPPEGEPEATWEDIAFDEVPTYYGQVKEVLDDHCMSCHAPGQIGHEGAPLDEIEIVVNGAEDIAYYAQTGYMPPWMPSAENVPLKNPRVLNAEDIAILTAWAEGGTPLGEPSAETAAVVEPTAVPQVRADMVLQQSEPYTPDTTNSDDYRCFLYDPRFEETTYLTGYIFEPDRAEIVHHAIVYRIDQRARAEAFARDGQDGKPGWSCYNTTGLGGRYEEMVGTWAPGTIPVFYPAGTGYPIDAGDVFVVQIHYNTAAGAFPDQTQVSLQFAEPGKRVLPLLTAELQAPVEIPCPEGVGGERCTREFAVNYAAERYGEQFRQRPDYLLSACNKTLARDYADLDASSASSSCDIVAPANIVAAGIFGHMHELGKSLRIELNPDTPDAQLLLDIPEWDFHWQDRYQFAEPITIQAGDVVRLTCVWDNTESETPRYIVWGEGTGDEMCFATVMMVGF
ncbi:MAG: monooxygenase [Anaerolineae bacterium]|nr:monooxygenase [Anaerolineae bacterium]